MRVMDLSENLIEVIKKDATQMVVQAMDPGSCGGNSLRVVCKGDFSEDSDIDIALLTRCGRTEAKKYNGTLSAIATEIAMKYFQIVNFVCLPYEEFIEKKSWYPYFYNIEKEGQILYG